jgi:hypothetical protein
LLTRQEKAFLNGVTFFGIHHEQRAVLEWAHSEDASNTKEIIDIFDKAWLLESCGK